MKKSTLFIVLFLFAGALYAQKKQQKLPKLALLSKVQNNAIVLRWAPLQAQTWLDGNKFGYKLLRYTMTRNNKVLVNKEVKSLFLTSKKPDSPVAFDKLGEKNKYAQTAKKLIFSNDPPEKSVDEQQNVDNARYLFGVFCADMSSEVAEAMALRFSDQTVLPNERYLYKLFINYPTGVKTTKLDTALCYTDLNWKHKDLPPKNLSLNYLDSVVTLKWDLGKGIEYTAFNMERSDDGGATYHKINQEPILPSADNPNDFTVIASDKVPIIYKTFYYRVKGISPFAEDGPASEVAKIYTYQTKLPAPIKPTFVLIKNTKIVISWNYPDSLIANIKGFKISYTKSLTEKSAINLTPKLLSNKERMFQTEVRDTYGIYQIEAIDLQDRIIPAIPLIIEAEDLNPPPPVDNLKAKVNKKGIVALSWTKSAAEDLYTYYIYRSDDVKNNMFLVKSLLSKDTIYTDTVSLNTTNKYIYYTVVPADNHLNATLINDTIKVKRPDIIPPLPPKFISHNVTDSLIRIDWVKSIDLDVVGYKILRADRPDTTLKLLATLDSTYQKTYYFDKNVEEGKSYTYVIQAIDDSGLASLAEYCKRDLFIAIPTRRPPITDFRYQLSEDKTAVQLSWIFAGKKVIKEYTIYRRDSPKSEILYYKTLKNKNSFSDASLKPGQYGYVITATLEDGSETIFSKELIVKIPEKE